MTCEQMQSMIQQIGRGLRYAGWSKERVRWWVEKAILLSAKRLEFLAEMQARLDELYGGLMLREYKVWSPLKASMKRRYLIRACEYSDVHVLEDGMAEVLVSGHWLDVHPRRCGGYRIRDPERNWWEVRKDKNRWIVEETHA